ncbi:MAG TPA: glycerol-3-phosphate 1-O-acyltransferase PlsY [Candidatus Goldiibacteriota bacterium]|nr:glycerol-3-phosphate 1-O-acyltransferase PlsY [Candidatus Goldiibacteriota bacterium]
MQVLAAILFIAGAYPAGSIPTGFIAVKAMTGKDIRKTGSGNIGATNVKRVLGMKWFLIVLFLDALKGFLPVFFCAMFLAEKYPFMPVLTGMAAILGHTFTVFLGFKGGKGVATSLGVFLAIAPLSLLTALAVFVTLLLMFGYISLGSIVSAALLPVFVFIYSEGSQPQLTLALAVSGAAFIIYKHKDNIKRLMEGTENKFEFSKSGEGEKKK